MRARARRARCRTSSRPRRCCTEESDRLEMQQYRAPGWLIGGNAQTIWPALFSRRHHGPAPAFRRDRWAAPDGDFVDVDWLGEDTNAPLLVLFHGLEGSSQSHYAQAFAHW